VDRRIEDRDGFIVLYYTVNFVEPLYLKSELDRWKSQGATVDVMPSPASAGTSPIGPQVQAGKPEPGAQGQIPSNTLRIREKRENLPLLERLLELLDQALPQVLVKAKLVEFSYDSKLEWGFEAVFDRAGADPLKTSETLFRSAAGTFNPESFLNASASRPFQGGALKFAFLGETKSEKGSFDYALRLLRTRGKAEIVGEPNVLATQGVRAEIKAGEEVPIQRSSLSGGGIIIDTQFKKTGITLAIVPELIGRDAVRLKIFQSFSVVTGFVTSQGGIQNPVINERSADTTVTLRDGSTLVIGGLISKRQQDIDGGIPILMDIPVLGWLFSSRSRQEVNTELYFFVTPEIVRGGYAEGIIRPPGEKERLEQLKDAR